MISKLSNKKATIAKTSSKSSIETVKPGIDASGFHKPSLFSWNPPLKSGKTQASNIQQKTLSSRAWDAFFNQDLASSIVTQIKTSVVNVGLKLNPTINGQELGLTDQQEDELESAISEEFECWSEECDIQRGMSFDEMQLLFLVNWFLNGNAIVNTFDYQYKGDLYSLKLQPIDADRMQNRNETPDTKDKYRGIRLNEFGAPVSYEFLNAHPSDLQTDPKGARETSIIQVYDKFGRKRLFHLFEKNKCDSLIGQSLFSSALGKMRNLDQYDESELFSAVVSSWLTFIIESKEFDDNNMGWEKYENDPRLGRNLNGSGRDSYELGPGATIEVDNGKQVKAFNPARPNSNYKDYYETQARSISASLGLPLEEVMLIFKDSFSASRASMLKGGKRFDMLQSPICRKILTPSYRLFFDESVSKGYLPHISKEYFTNPRIRRKYQSHEWLTVGHGAIDEKAQVTASHDKVFFGFSDLPKEASKLSGRNYKKIARQNAKAKRFYERIGLEWPFQKIIEEPKIESEEGEFNDDKKPESGITIPRNE